MNYLSQISIPSSLLIIVSAGLVGLSNSQNMRVAPGVPPQHYDPNVAQQQQYGGHPPPPQQYQQQQFQQPPHQHVPVQQHQQQQVPFQQPPHGHGPPQPQQPAHGHEQPGAGHAHHGQPQILDTSNIGQERQHIQDHMSVPIDTSQMNNEELQFHYFKMHDADNNHKLDGCELVKSLIHWHDESNHDPKAGHPIPDAKLFKDEELMNMIDPILDNDDKNRDGFIDYGEFVQAQAAAASRIHEGAEDHAVPIEDNQIAQVVDEVLEYDVNGDGMIDYGEFGIAQNLAQKKKNQKKCQTCRD